MNEPATGRDINERPVDTKGAEPLAGHSEGTLANLRVKGGGPDYIKVGRKVLYYPSDIRRWLESKRISSTSEAA